MSTNRTVDDAALPNRYVELFEARDLEGIVTLYAEDATVEDPVGRPPVQGREALRAFYAQALDSGVHPRPVGPVRGAGGEYAMPLAVEIPAAGAGLTLDETFVVAEGHIRQMRSYWNLADVPGFQDRPAG